MSKYTVTGVCNFCGQQATLPANEEMDEQQTNKYITEHCKCEKARHIRAKYDLTGKVHELLAEDRQRGFEGTPTETVYAVRAAANAVLDGVLFAAQLTLPCGDVVKIKTEFPDSVVMTREFKRTKKA